MRNKFNDFTSGIQCDKIENFGKGTDTKSANLYQNSQNLHSNTANLNHSENPHPTPPRDSKILQDSQQTQKTHKGEQQAEVSLSDFGSFASESKGVTLKGNDRSLSEAIYQKHQRANADSA